MSARRRLSARGLRLELVWVAFFTSGTTWAAHQKDPGAAAEARAWFATLALLNETGPVEPAYAHGSIGIGIGVGLSTVALPEDGPSPLIQRQLGVDAGVKSYRAPRIWLVKGLPWPVDIGLTGASLSGDDQDMTQGAASLQWTIFEALGLPALSARAAYGRVMGALATEFSTTSVGLAASWGFWRHVTVYGAGNVRRHQARLLIDDHDRSLAYLLEEGDAERRFDDEVTVGEGTLGVRLAILPPFVAVTLEGRRESGALAAYTLKVAAGM